MSAQHYNQLAAEARELKNKCNNADFQVFGNKVRTLDVRARNIVKAAQAGGVNSSHINELNQALLPGQEIQDFQSAGLNEGDFSRWESLVKVSIRGDYAELESLREAGKPETVVALRNENERLQEQVEYLHQRLAEIELRDRILEAASRVSAEAVETAKLILQQL